MTERFDRSVKGFAYTAANPIQAQAAANYALNPIPELPVSAFQVLGGLQFAGGANGRDLWSQPALTYLPRIGLAYQLGSKTVFRGGYGIFYDTIGTNRSAAIQTGFTATTPIIPSFDSGVTYAATLANPFPNGLLAPAGSAGGLTTNLGQALTVYPTARVQPYSQRWSFGFQRELPGSFLLDAAYVGNHAIHLPVNRELNASDPRYLSTSSTRDQTAIDFLNRTFANPFYGLNSVYGKNITRSDLLRPYPEFGSIQETEPIGYAWYHALQAQVVKRFARLHAQRRLHIFEEHGCGNQLSKPQRQDSLVRDLYRRSPPAGGQRNLGIADWQRTRFRVAHPASCGLCHWRLAAQRGHLETKRRAAQLGQRYLQWRHPQHYAARR